MASESEGLADIAAAILADPSFRDEAERCRALAHLGEWTRDQPPHTDYAAAPNGGCTGSAGGG
jgi:hypothetical protein